MPHILHSFFIEHLLASTISTHSFLSCDKIPIFFQTPPTVNTPVY